MSLSDCAGRASRPVLTSLSFPFCRHLSLGFVEILWWRFRLAITPAHTALLWPLLESCCFYHPLGSYLLRVPPWGAEQLLASKDVPWVLCWLCGAVYLTPRRRQGFSGNGPYVLLEDLSLNPCTTMPQGLTLGHNFS